MSLKETVEDLYVSLVGNRVNTLGLAMFAGSGYTFCNYYGTLPTMFSILGIVVSGGFLSFNKFGEGTKNYYRRTLQEIDDNNGTLPLEWVQEKIKKVEFGNVLGYCQLQGMYLAAKKRNQLNSFYSAKKAVSNNIFPNF
jgi:hypothetical protein